MYRTSMRFLVGLTVIATSVGSAPGAGAQESPFSIVEVGDFEQPGPGTGISMVVRPNGNPLIAHTRGGSLYLQDCQDPTCEDVVERKFTYPAGLDLPSIVNSYLALDDNGAAAIVARARETTIPPTPDKIVVVRCNGDPCTDTTINTVYTGLSGFPSMAMTMVGPNRTLPLIFARNGGELKSFSCLNATCEDVTVTSLAPHEAQGDVAVEFVPGDGKARVLYTAPGYDVTFAECADVPCTSLINPVILREGDPPNTFPGAEASLRFNNGGWVAAYQVQNIAAQRDLHMIFSVNSEFSNAQEENVLGVDDRYFAGKLEIGPEGGVYLLAKQPFPGGNLWLFQCSATSCLDDPAVVSIPPVAIGGSFSHDLAIANGAFLVAFAEDRGNGNKLWLASAPREQVFPEINHHQICVYGPGNVPVDGARVVARTVANAQAVLESLTGPTGCGSMEIPAAAEGTTIRLDVSPPLGVDPEVLRWVSQADWAYGVNEPVTFEVHLEEARKQPPEVKVTQAYSVSGVPVVPNGWPIQVQVATGCNDGSGTVSILPDGPAVPVTDFRDFTAFSPLLVLPTPSLPPRTVSIEIECLPHLRDGAAEPEALQKYDFEIFVEPTAHVRTVGGAPLYNAQVMLLRSLDSDGPFGFVPNGSTIMSPGNRENVDHTDRSGRFGWATVGGYYRVRAQLAGCHAPGNSAVAFVESQIVQVGPDVLDLDMRLECAAGTSPMDADCDDAHTAADSLLSLQVLAGLEDDPGCVLDADGVGGHTPADVLLQLRVLAGLGPFGPQ